MIPNGFSRRRFLQTIMASLFLAGCRSQAARQITPPTTAPFNLLGKTAPATAASPTPIPAADGVVVRYLEAWSRGHYEAMYELLSPESQGRISYYAFYEVYQNARALTTATGIQTQLQSLLVEDVRATATFRSRWATVLFDTIEADHTMRLRFEDGRWLIVWEPMLVLPQLGHGVKLSFLEERPKRGLIYDSEDQALALEKQLVTIGVVPSFIEDQAQVVQQLSPIIGLAPDDIAAEIRAAQPDWFVPLADIDFEESVQYYDILSDLAGVQRRARPVRAYSTGMSAAHVIGMMGGIPADQLDSYKKQGYQGDELIGLSGVEGWGEFFLAGRRGGQLVTLGTGNKVLAEIASAAPQPGGNIYLSLDIALQTRAEDILGARRGAIVVMEPTGFIRALASYPRFRPGDFATGIDPVIWSALLNDQDRPLVNRPTQGLYPPASVFKIISAAAAMEHLGYSGETPFFCSGVWYGLGDEFVKKCWLETGHGYINLQEGITQSCDVVFYEIGLALHREDPNWLPQMARAFGLGQPTGVMGVEELGGVVPDNAWKLAVRNEPFFDGDAVNMAIGQGDILTTPLQIARVMAAMANEGALYRPQLVRRISSRDAGDQLFEPEATGTLPVSPETLATIRRGLLGVVQGRYGTARKAFAGWPYTAAGKTGTAETVLDKPHAWFAGYAPVDDPQVIIVVLLENAGEGSKEAAPLFRAVADAYFAALA